MNDYARWSGIAFQMLATIGLFTYGGYWLDGHYQTKFPIWTLCLSIAGVVISLVQVIRSLPKS